MSAPNTPDQPMTAELLAAYLATGYRLTLPGPDGATLALRVGRRHPGLDRWLVRHHPGVSDWTWLTAVNPRSRPLGRAANLQRLTDLVAALAAAGFDCCPGLARDPTGRWPDEASVFVPGMKAATGCDWGRRFEQHAILAGAIGRAARLWLCGPPAPA
ncbi:MAG: DUF3293 domain-containing protein [Pseudomonadota bacterium]|nr:DUF3293 domain-containing protein [Pseudomonadota bacterium]